MRWLHLVIPLVLVVGCGDDDDEGSSDTEPPITEATDTLPRLEAVAEPETTPPDAEPATTDPPAPTDPPATTDPLPPTDPPAEEGMPYCDTTAELSVAFEGLDLSGATPPDRLEESVSDYEALLNAAVDSSPSELANDWMIYAAPQELLFGELADLQFDATLLPPESLAFTQDPAFLEANEAIYLYDIDVCGAGQ